jgi:hypothetical protein
MRGIMNKKFLAIGGSVIAVVAVVVALIFVFTGREDAYRSIKVFEIEGSCKVERGGDSLDAFENMELISGDTLTVGEGSFARLKFDDDKYVYLEANTTINLTATGTDNDSKTIIFVERGSMLTEVKKKLSATSSFDIVTPNTIMSIRGTKTLTQVLEDTVTGHVQTSNAVLEGQVKIKAVKVKADGTVVSVEKALSAGEGNALSSNKEELVSQEEMKSIADIGASVNVIKVEIVSEEDADVVFDVATFEASFLENVKNILVADAQGESDEEGLSQKQIDEINALLDEVLIAFDAISEDSQKAIDETVKNILVADAQAESDEEGLSLQLNDEINTQRNEILNAFDVKSEKSQKAIVVAIPKNDHQEVAKEIAPEPISEITPDDRYGEYTPIPETGDIQDEGTTVIDGDTKLLVISDDEKVDDVADKGNEDKEDNEEEEFVEEEKHSYERTDETTKPVDDQNSGSSTEMTETVNITYGSTTAYVHSSSDSNLRTPVRLIFYEERIVEGSHLIDQVELPTSLPVGSPLPGTENSTIRVECESEEENYYEFAGWYKTQDGAINLVSSERVDSVQSGNMTIYPGVRVETSELSSAD